MGLKPGICNGLKSLVAVRNVKESLHSWVEMVASDGRLSSISSEKDPIPTKDLVRNNFPVWAADASPLAALVLT